MFYCNYSPAEFIGSRNLLHPLCMPKPLNNAKIFWPGQIEKDDLSLEWLLPIAKSVLGSNYVYIFL